MRGGWTLILVAVYLAIHIATAIAQRKKRQEEMQRRRAMAEQQRRMEARPPPPAPARPAANRAEQLAAQRRAQIEQLRQRRAEAAQRGGSKQSQVVFGPPADSRGRVEAGPIRGTQPQRPSPPRKPVPAPAGRGRVGGDSQPSNQARAQKPQQPRMPAVPKSSPQLEEPRHEPAHEIAGLELSLAGADQSESQAKATSRASGAGGLLQAARDHQLTQGQLQEIFILREILDPPIGLRESAGPPGL